MGILAIVIASQRFFFKQTFQLGKSRINMTEEMQKYLKETFVGIKEWKLHGLENMRKTDYTDRIKSIEKNGNYWLSQSNTAYHIINPNATSLTTIEANGYYSLAKGDDTYYVLDGNGNSTRLDHWDITNRVVGNFFEFTI